MQLISGEQARRRLARRKKSLSRKAKLHALTTGVAKAPKPLIESQKLQASSFKASAIRGTAYASAAVAGFGAGYGIVKLGGAILRSPARGFGAAILANLVIDNLDPDLAQKVHNKHQRARGADQKRKIRAKLGEGNLFQRALDFDAIEYLSGAYNDRPKTSRNKTRSVKGELATSSKGKGTKSKTKSAKRKTSANKPKRAGRMVKYTRNGKIFTRRNPHYGK